jgi:hypothetical protein
MPLPQPDAFGVPYEFQVIQNKDHLVIIHEYPGSFRIVPLDGEPHQVVPIRRGLAIPWASGRATRW